eukprot:jgi/Tetstr1/442739/TSEL_030828.t1
MLAALLDYLWIIWEGLGELLFDNTLWFTKYAFSRAPLTPALKVEAVRARRARLLVDTRLSSRFNVETYQVQRAELGAAAEDAWESCHEDEGRHVTVNGLEPSTDYGFRVRTRNYWGVSSWSPVVRLQTLIDPVAGGGLGPGYSWQQTATEVQLEFPLLGCEGLKARQVSVELSARRMAVKVHLPEGVANLLEGELSAAVRPLGEGSFWELHKEGKVTNIVLTLEKSMPVPEKELGARRGKRDGIWSCVVMGHPQIDVTRVLEL